MISQFQMTSSSDPTQLVLAFALHMLHRWEALNRTVTLILFGTIHTVTEGSTNHSYPLCCYGNQPSWICCFTSKAEVEAHVKTMWKQTPAVIWPLEKTCENMRSDEQSNRQTGRQAGGWIAYLACWASHIVVVVPHGQTNPDGPELTSAGFIRAVRLTPLITGLSASRQQVGTLGLISTSRLTVTSDFNNTDFSRLR